MALLPARDDGFDDVHVPGAAADVPLERDPDVVLRRVRIPLEESGRAHQHPRRAVAALQRVVLVERLLERGELTVGREALDGRDLRAVGLDREEHAALHRLAVEMHGAGAAVARVAADVSPGQPEIVPDEVDEQAPCGHLHLDLLAVDLERDDTAACRFRH